jgi:hypothetical protein
MKTSVFSLLLLCGWAVVATAQQPGLAPILSQAKLSADGKTLEVQRATFAPVQQTRNRQVPTTVLEEVNGEQRTKTVYETVQETYTTMETRMVCVPCALDTIEIRTAQGGKYEPDDLPALFTEEFTPVILVERYATQVDGKRVTKAVRFDTSYLKLFQPDVLLVFLPPANSPVGVTPTATAPVPNLIVPRPPQP